LRNPLGAIVAAAALLRRRSDLSLPASAHVERIDRAARRMSEMTRRCSTSRKFDSTAACRSRSPRLMVGNALVHGAPVLADSLVRDFSDGKCRRRVLQFGARRPTPQA
jgi:hypothetical protein